MSAHSFDPVVAEEVGVNAAVIYQNIVFWCEKNAVNERHIHDGLAWTYNSMRAFTEMFAYLTADQIRRAIDRLIEAGYIATGNFNETAYDRTKWYCDLRQIHLAPIPNGFGENPKPIPDSKPDSKPDDKPDSKPRERESGLFSAEDLPKKKPDEVTSILTEVLPEATAKDWIAHRKALKKALTPQGARLMVGKLREADDPVACVEVSMMNGWQGVFPERQVKDQPTGGHRLRENWGEIVR